MRRESIMRLSAVLVIITLLAMCISGCGGASGTDKIRAAADGLMTAIQSNDFEKIAEYSTEDMLNDGDLSDLKQMKDLADDLLPSLGVSKENLSEDAVMAIEDLSDSMIRGLIKSYEITDVQKDDEAGYVSLNVSYGFDVSAFEEESYDQELSGLVEKYTTENLEELVKVLNEEGEEALMLRIVNGVLPDICAKIKEKVLGTGERTETVIMKVENIEGSWKVTEAKISE